MGAEYLFYVKFIATEAPTFFGFIISVLASVITENRSVQWDPQSIEILGCLGKQGTIYR